MKYFIAASGLFNRKGFVFNLLCFVFAAAIAGYALPAAAFLTTDLGTLNSYSARSIPTAINNAGQIVGYSLANMDDHAFLWQYGVMTDLGTLGGFYSYAVDINERGRIVGSASTTGEAATHAFSWQNGAMTDLGTLGGWDSWASSINDAGQVIGTSLVGPNRGSGEPIYSFFWENGVMTNLGSFSAVGINNQAVVGMRSDPAGNVFISTWRDGVITDVASLGTKRFRPVLINEAGQMAGYCSDPQGGATSQACFWNNAELIGLGTLGGSNIILSGLSPKGHIVGESTTASGDPHAFLWKDGVMTDLGTFGGRYSMAGAVNSAGQVVGESSSASDRVHAFLWENGVMTDLGTLNSPDPANDYSTAYLINEEGQIVGMSYSPESSDLHGVLWTTKGAPALLADLVAMKDGFALPNGLSTSLGAKLRNAETHLADGTTTTTCNALGTFVQEAGAQSGKALTLDQVDRMIYAAQTIERVLSCR